MYTRNSRKLPTSWKNITKICRIWSLPSKKASSTCSRRENGKRTADSALRIAVALVEEGLCTKEEAILKVDPKQLDSEPHPQFNAEALKAAEPVASGLAASPGAACGAIYFTADDAKEAAKNGPVLLVRLETSPEDLAGMVAAEGILTCRGGMTSHAAVVARGMGTCCVGWLFGAIDDR